MFVSVIDDLCLTRKTSYAEVGRLPRPDRVDISESGRTHLAGNMLMWQIAANFYIFNFELLFF